MLSQVLHTATPLLNKHIAVVHPWTLELKLPRVHLPCMEYTENAWQLVQTKAFEGQFTPFANPKNLALDIQGKSQQLTTNIAGRNLNASSSHATLLDNAICNISAQRRLLHYIQSKRMAVKIHT